MKKYLASFLILAAAFICGHSSDAQWNKCDAGFCSVVASTAGACSNTTPFVFNSGASNVATPSGCTSVIAEAWGGGGAGGGASSTFGGGACGGGYDKSPKITVTPGQSVFYSVAAGVTGTTANGANGNNSWVNPSANSQPSSNGAAASGGAGGVGINGAGQGCSAVGTGLIAGNTHFNGGQGANGSSANLRGGGGGGGAGSAGNGTDGSQLAGSSPGGAGGSPEGGTGGDGGSTGSTGGSIVGGGGGGSWNASTTGGNGAAGRVRITFGN